MKLTATESAALAQITSAAGPMLVMDVTVWPRTIGTDSPYASQPACCSAECGQRTEPCANGCGVPIMYVPDHYHARRHVTGQWWHVDGRSLCQSGPDALPACAHPVPCCPSCQSVRYVATDTPWGVTTDCADCGRHDYMSIGD